MKRLLFTIAIMILVYIPVVSAIEINAEVFMNAVGMRLTDQAKQITVDEGQTLKATIEKGDFLIKQGMKGLTKGDTIEITYIGDKTWKFVHIPSGQQLIRKQGTDFPANFLK